MPVRDPLGAAAAALGRANGPWEGASCGRRDGGMERWRWGGGCGAQGLRALVTDGWPPHWEAVATRSVVRLIRGGDSVAKIKRHCGR